MIARIIVTLLTVVLIVFGMAVVNEIESLKTRVDTLEKEWLEEQQRLDDTTI